MPGPLRAPQLPSFGAFVARPTLEGRKRSSPRWRNTAM
jgi:hypothetical protein